MYDRCTAGNERKLRCFGGIVSHLVISVWRRSGRLDSTGLTECRHFRMDHDNSDDGFKDRFLSELPISRSSRSRNPT